MTPQKVQKIIHNIIIPQNILFIFDPFPPPKKKNEIQNFEPPKVDRTYLFMIILEYPPPPPKADHCFYRSMRQNIAVCLLASQSINQSASQPEQPRRLSYFVKAYTCYIKVVACPRDGGKGVHLIFSSLYVWSGPASTVHQKNIKNFKYPKKYLKF